MKRHKLKTRHGLNQFVKLLTKAAEAAWHDEELRPRERALFLRQGDIFSTAVAELIEILKDHQDPDVREDRLFSLYKAVGSAAVIASHRMIDPVGNRRRATSATKGTVAQAQELERIVKGIAKTARRPNEGPWTLAGRILATVNEQILNDPRLKKSKRLERGVKQDTVARYLQQS